MNADAPRRRIVLLAVAVVAMGVAGLFAATGWLGGLEKSSVDARFKLRGTQAPPSDVVIVGVDDKTLASAPNGRPPLDRTRHAKVIEQLTKAGANVIGYDPVHRAESEDADADNALIEAVAAAGKIVLGTGDVNPDGSTTIFGGGEGLEYSGATPARHALPRRRERRGNEATACAGCRSRSRSSTTSRSRSSKQARGQAFQPPAGKDALIDFPGPPGTIPVLSFADVEKGDFDPAKVHGKIVVVGATSQRGNDLLATSTSGGGLMSRAEVEAAAIETALRGFPLRPPAGWLDALLALLVAATAPLMALRFRILVASGAGLLALVAYLVAAQIAFAHGLVLTIVPAIAGAVTGLLGTALVSHPTESPAVNRVLDRITRKGGNQRTRRLRALLLVAAAFSVVTLTLLADAAKLLRNADYSTVDMRFSLRGQQPAPNDVVIVALDDKTLNSEPKPTYPLSRDWYARTCATSPGGREGDRHRRRFAEESGNTEERQPADRGVARRARTWSCRPRRPTRAARRS